MTFKSRVSLYVDENGNTVKGRYIWSKAGGKYQAMLKYPEGYCKSKTFYDLEEAVAFVRNDYIRYAPGWYYDENMGKVFLKRPDEIRPERMY